MTRHSHLAIDGWTGIILAVAGLVSSSGAMAQSPCTAEEIAQGKGNCHGPLPPPSFPEYESPFGSGGVLKIAGCTPMEQVRDCPTCGIPEDICSEGVGQSDTSGYEALSGLVDVLRDAVLQEYIRRNAAAQESDSLALDDPLSDVQSNRLLDTWDPTAEAPERDWEAEFLLDSWDPTTNTLGTASPTTLVDREADSTLEFPDIEESSRLSSYFGVDSDSAGGPSRDERLSSYFARTPDSAESPALDAPPDVQKWASELSDQDLTTLINDFQRIAGDESLGADAVGTQPSAQQLASLVPEVARVAIAGDVIRETTRAAVVADLAYRAKDQGENLTAAPGHTLLLSADTESGLQAVVTRHEGTNAVYVGFAGTEDGDDWVQNVANFLREEAPVTVDAEDPLLGGVYQTLRAMGGQLEDARQVTEAAKKLVAKDYPDAKIIVTGHSLGGAIAQYESARTGFAAHTYNAPGMASVIAKDLGRVDTAQIINHMRKDDPVAWIGQHAGSSLAYENPSPLTWTTADGRQVSENRDGPLQIHDRTLFIEDLVSARRRGSTSAKQRARSLVRNGIVEVRASTKLSVKRAPPFSDEPVFPKLAVSAAEGLVAVDTGSRFYLFDGQFGLLFGSSEFPAGFRQSWTSDSEARLTTRFTEPGDACPPRCLLLEGHPLPLFREIDRLAESVELRRQVLSRIEIPE